MTSVALFVVVSVTMASAMLVSVSSACAQGFLETFNVVDSDWKIVGNPGNFTTVYVGNANYALLTSSGAGGASAGGTHDIVGAGNGDWSATLWILSAASLISPSANGHLDFTVNFDGGQQVILALTTSGGNFGLVATGPNGSCSSFTPYAFTGGTVFYPMVIASSGGSISFSFGGNDNFWNTSGAGLTPRSVSLIASGNVAGYVVDNLGIMAIPAPEPSTFALMGIGFATLVIFRRLR